MIELVNCLLRTWVQSLPPTLKQNKTKQTLAWWLTCVVSELRKQRQKDTLRMPARQSVSHWAQGLVRESVAKFNVRSEEMGPVKTVPATQDRRREVGSPALGKRLVCVSVEPQALWLPETSLFTQDLLCHTDLTYLSRHPFTIMKVFGEKLVNSLASETVQSPYFKLSSLR